LAQQLGIKHDLSNKCDALKGCKMDGDKLDTSSLQDVLSDQPTKEKLKAKKTKKWGKGKYKMQQEVGHIAKDAHMHTTPESNRQDKKHASQCMEAKVYEYEPGLHAKHQL